MMLLKGSLILMIAGCLLGTSARPTRPPYFRTALRQRSSYRPAVNPPLDDLALSGLGMDQSAEASSNVDQIVPHNRNQLDFGKFNYRYTDYFKYKSDKSTPPLEVSQTTVDCSDCGTVVTLGESRSYSVVTNPQFPSVQPLTEPDTITNEQESTASWITSQPEEVTEEVETKPTEAVEEKIISVRVSSSIGTSVGQEPAALQVEELPFATSVQRSHFSVEEADHEPLAESGEMQNDDFESSKLVNIGSSSTSATETPPVASYVPVTSTVGLYPTPSNSRGDRSYFVKKTNVNEDTTSRNREELRPTLPLNEAQVVLSTSPTVNPLSSPVSYHTSLQSATSGSRVSFYRDPPSLRRQQNTSPTTTSTTPSPSSPVEPYTQRLKHETRVETVSFHEEVVLPQKAKEKSENQTVNKEKSYQFTNVHDQSFHHVQVTHLNDKKRLLPYSSPATYHQSERVYGTPEQNYEVDEALSLRTNGRAHGIQNGSTARPDSNKFGYVVEGRDYKKYRVEERTADGFIVGEYGVVRHEDGNLRGVRYTADSTINPKVIYEALVKFLSL